VLKAYIILKKKHKVILGIIVISVLLLTFIEFINFFFLQQLIGFFSSSQIQVDSAFYKNLPKNLYTNIKHLLILLMFLKDLNKLVSMMIMNL
jgi:hypothetical protein